MRLPCEYYREVTNVQSNTNYNEMHSLKAKFENSYKRKPLPPIVHYTCNDRNLWQRLWLPENLCLTGLLLPSKVCVLKMCDCTPARLA